MPEKWFYYHLCDKFATTKLSTSHFCTVVLHSPVEKLNLVWRRNGVEVASGVGSYSRRLTIINPTSADVGMYMCEASLLDSSVKPAEARAFLTITGKSHRPIKAPFLLSVTILSQLYVCRENPPS